MTLVVDTLRISTVTDELSNAEVSVIAGLFDLKNFKDGEVIVRAGDERADNLYILGHGGIDVKIESGEGDFTIHVLKPGDLAGMITFVGGISSEISATLCSVGDTQVLSMERDKFESLVNAHPMIMYRFMRGLARSMHGIVRRGNSQSAELSNYIYTINGRY
jgi:CRP-like cAMP-binding protein